jgi:hypothetical protein
MSDITYIPLADQTAGVVARLARLRSQVAAWFWVEGLVRVVWLALALFAVDMALDWLFRMDRAQRGVMLVLMLGAIGWAVIRWLVRPLSATLSDDALALQVEDANQRLGQGLISALQLSRIEDAGSRGMSPLLVRQAVRSGLQLAQEISFANVIDYERFRRNSLLLLVAVLFVVGIGAGTLVAGPLQIWASRNLFLSNATWPQKTYLVIERVGEDGRVVFPRGEDWTQVVSVRPDSQLVPEVVYLDFRHGGARHRAPLTMKRTSERQFEATFASVIEPFEFRARGGDAVTDWVRVELVEQPAVAELKLTVTPPHYAGGQADELTAGRGPYYVLAGSSLSVDGTANKHLQRAELLIDKKRVRLELLNGVAAAADGTPRTVFHGQVNAGELMPGTYTIDLEDTLGLVSRRPTTFALRRRIDREPRLRARLIGISGMVLPQARIPFSCRATDDFGLTKLHVSYRFKGDDAAQTEGQGSLEFEQLKDLLAGQSVGQPSRLPEIAFEDVIELAPLKTPAGTGFSFRFEAADNDDIGGPNVGRSSEFLVRVVTEEELRTDLLRREKEQRQEFERLLKNQEDLLTDSRALEAAVKNEPNLTAEQKDQLIACHKRQKLVGQNVAAIAERMAGIVIEVQNNRLEEEGGRLQTRLTKEIVEPMHNVAEEMIPQGVLLLDKTRRQAAVSGDRNAALADAIAVQTEAVARMKEILEHMVKAEGFQEAVNLLYEIQKAQTEVHDQTNKARQERIKRILEGEHRK